jgi:hypothetical protein
MKDWYDSHPHLFVKRPYDRPGCDIYAVKRQLVKAAVIDGRLFKILANHLFEQHDRKT